MNGAYLLLLTHVEMRQHPEWQVRTTMPDAELGDAGLALGGDPSPVDATDDHAPRLGSELGITAAELGAVPGDPFISTNPDR